MGHRTISRLKICKMSKKIHFWMKAPGVNRLKSKHKQYNASLKTDFYR